MPPSSPDRYRLIANVQSESTPGKTWPVKWDTSREELTCPCWPWKTSKPRSCPHVRFVQQQLMQARMSVSDALLFIERYPTAVPPIGQVVAHVAQQTDAVYLLFRDTATLTLAQFRERVETIVREHGGRPAPALDHSWIGGNRAIILRD